jgi:uncharacterized protein (DUF1800 family)
MRTSGRPLRLVLPAIVTLTFCDPGLLAEKKSAVPARPDDRTIIHVLNRIGFGPAPGDVARVRELGLQAYIDRQLQPNTLADAAMAPRLASFETLTKSTRELADDYFLPALLARREQQRQAGAAGSPNGAAEPRGDPGTSGARRRGGEAEMTQQAQDPSMSAAARPRDTRTPQQIDAMQGARQVLVELSQQKILRAAYSERQLEEVMVDFWFNHFNVFAGKGQTRVYLTEYERDAIRPHALGKFSDLLRATAESPAMLFYLDNWQSSAPIENAMADPRARSRNPIQVNPRRRPGARPGNAGLAGGRTATLADLPPAAQNRRPRGINENYARELMELHTLGVDGGYTQKDVQEVARAFTGWTIANPRQGGGFRFEPRMHDDGEKLVLGHKIKSGGGQKDGEQVLEILAKQPATSRFIATKLVRRFVADEPPKALVDRAAQRFRETDGDIREVVRTIVTSPEFFAPSAYRAKVKTPFEFVVSAVRATGVDMRDALPALQTLRDLGMPLYMCQPPTGYADRAEAWVNTGALLNRMNFAVALTSGRLRGVASVPLGSADQARTALVSDALAGDLSETTATTIAKATEPSQALALVLGSPEFQRR